MMNCKEILAQNLKENRRRLRITQPELAERVGMSTQYLAMIEIARKFPTADILERLAAALDIPPHELFSVSVSPERAIVELQEAVLKSVDQRIYESMERATQTLEQVVAESVKKALADQLKGIKSPVSGESQPSERK